MTEKLTRREALKMTALAAAGTGAALLLPGCSESMEDDIDRRIDRDIYRDTARDTIKAKDVISEKKGFAGVKPNVVLILCDDMGYGDLGCYGSKAIETPNIDKLAREGVRFTDFYSCNALCSPSRAGLLTGRYPHRTGVTFPIWPKDDNPLRSASRVFGTMMAKLGALDLPFGKSLNDGLPLSEITIAEALKLVGYKTGAIGKWHLGDFTKQPEYHPFKHGFDFFTGFNGSNDDWPTAFWRNDKEITADIQLDQEKYTGLFTEEALKFINENKNEPFFLYLAHKDPHQPCIPSKRFRNSSKGGRHGDVIQEVDWSVGEVMKALKENGLDNRTLVLFASDNGPWFNGSPGGNRGRKGQSYEGGFNVPMIARYPGKIPAGSVCREPSMNIDFFPTCLGLAGLNLPKDRIIDGKNIFGLMSGREKKSPHEALFFFHENDLEGVRAGHWKYFRYMNHYVHPIVIDNPKRTFSGLVTKKAQIYTGKDSSGKEKTIPVMGSWPMLYNLKTDKGENYNVIDTYPETGKKMLQIMTDWEKKFYKNPRGWK